MGDYTTVYHGNLNRDYHENNVYMCIMVCHGASLGRFDHQQAPWCFMVVQCAPIELTLSSIWCFIELHGAQRTSSMDTPKNVGARGGGGMV